MWGNLLTQLVEMALFAHLIVFFIYIGKKGKGRTPRSSIVVLVKFAVVRYEI